MATKKDLQTGENDKPSNSTKGGKKQPPKKTAKKLTPAEERLKIHTEAQNKYHAARNK